jgi:hypothetical protein
MPAKKYNCEAQEIRPGVWVATCNSFPGLSVTEESRKLALRTMKKLCLELESDMRQWKQDDPMIQL